MNLPCEVIRDLLPLVQDGVASEESSLLVREHLATCECCKNNDSLTKAVETDEGLDKKLLSSLRKTAFGIGVGLLLIGAVLGAALIDTSVGVFYNFVLMPALGILGFWLLGKKCFLVPIGAFLISFLWQIPESGWYGWFYSLLFALFSAIGILIAYLLKVAFGKGEGQ